MQVRTGQDAADGLCEKVADASPFTQKESQRLDPCEILDLRGSYFAMLHSKETVRCADATRLTSAMKL